MIKVTCRTTLHYSKKYTTTNDIEISRTYHNGLSGLSWKDLHAIPFQVMIESPAHLVALISEWSPDVVDAEE